MRSGRTGDWDRDDTLGDRLSPAREALVREAMDAWEAVCGVRFMEVQDSTAADVRIGFQPMHSHLGPDYGSDGAENIQGVTWSWFVEATLMAQSVVFDPAEEWTPTMFYDVALHELGHVLGIDHSDVAQVVMSGEPLTPYHDQHGRDELEPDDVTAAVQLWGVPGSSVPPGAQSTGGKLFAGSEEGDRLTGTGRDDTMHGNGGDDTLLGGAGEDTMFGGIGDWNGEANVLDGGPGDDDMTAGSSASAGGDRFIFAPGHGDDVVAGNWGSQHSEMAYGAPEKIDLTAFGSAAPSWQQIQATLTEVTTASAAVHASSALIDLTAFGGGTITFRETDASDLDAGDFIGLGLGEPSTALGWTIGDAGADTLEGGAGNDSLSGVGGNDALFGGPGDDAVLGGTGDDRIWGQAGNDTLRGQEGEDVIFGQDGADRLEGGPGGDVILAGDGDDVATGDGGASPGGGEADRLAGDDRILGEGGDDTLRGQSGNDFLAGGPGQDFLSGEDGADYLDGGTGNDTLRGDAGYDAMAGGAGADRLIGAAEGDTFFGQAGADIFVIAGGTSWVMDWKPSEGDRIEIGARAIVTGRSQAGEHACVDVSDGSTVFLALTDVDALSGDDWFITG